MLNRLTKIKAGALQYVLVISVIIAIILLTFILLINLQNKLSAKHLFYKQAILNVNYGFDYLSNTDIEYNQVLTKQFSDNIKESTLIFKKKWGLFEVGSVVSKVGQEHFQKLGLLGWQQGKKKALYLQDNNTPLVMVGDAKIIGDVFLPKRGVKTGNIGGTSFYNNKLIEGVKHASTNKLPQISNSVVIEQLLKHYYLNDSIQNFELEENLNIIQSFNKKTLLHETTSSIYLQNISLKGNIIVRSDKKITIAASAKLNDIILVAPEIVLEKNVTGNFQAFATKAITINENCKINYPSSLVLFLNRDKAEKSQKENKIELKQGVVFKGVIIYKKENSELQQGNYNPQIIIKEKAIVTGEIYCEANLELLGEVKGMVVTKNFITNQQGSTYINHILNGTINANKLPTQYVGLNLNSSNQNIAKWLY